MALSEVSYSFRICVNSVMSEVHIGVVSKMKTSVCATASQSLCHDTAIYYYDLTGGLQEPCI